jgi:hypothetical protein
MQSLQRLCGQIKSSIDQANRLLRALSSLSLHALPITHYLLPITDNCIPPALDARLTAPAARWLCRPSGAAFGSLPRHLSR